MRAPIFDTLHSAYEDGGAELPAGITAAGELLVKEVLTEGAHDEPSRFLRFPGPHALVAAEVPDAGARRMTAENQELVEVPGDGHLNLMPAYAVSRFQASLGTVLLTGPNRLQGN